MHERKIVPYYMQQKVGQGLGMRLVSSSSLHWYHRIISTWLGPGGKGNKNLVSYIVQQEGHGDRGRNVGQATAL